MMKVLARCLFAILSLNAVCIAASLQTVTLYPPHDPISNKYSEGKACFSFKYGLLKEGTGTEWDLAYGFTVINGEDWFKVNVSNGNRSVIVDLGELKWDDPISVPALAPLPPVPKDGQRIIVLDASADTHERWAKTTRTFAKVVLGHIYAMHVKDSTADFYVLFRVEDFEQHKHCAISWRLAAPVPAEQPNALDEPR